MGGADLGGVASWQCGSVAVEMSYHGVTKRHSGDVEPSADTLEESGFLV